MRLAALLLAATLSAQVHPFPGPGVAPIGAAAIEHTALGTTSGAGSAPTISSVSITTGATVLVGATIFNTREMTAVAFSGGTCAGTFAEVQQEQSSGSVETYQWAAHNVTGGTCDIVGTISVSTNYAMLAREVRNLAASPFDVAAKATGNSNNPASGPTATTAQANEFWWGVIGQNVTTIGGTWANSFSAGQSVSFAGRGTDEGFRLPAATGTAEAEKTTTTTSAEWTAMVAAFKGL